MAQVKEGAVHEVEANLGPASAAAAHALEVGHTVALTGLHVTGSTVAVAGGSCGTFTCKCTWTEVGHLSTANYLS